MKRILITGANSYIGTSLERYMEQWPEQYQVDTLDMRGDDWRHFSFSGYDSVVHVAGIAHISTKKLDAPQKQAYWDVNAVLPVKTAEKAKEAGVQQFIFLSSMSVYGEHGSIKNPVVITDETLPNPKDIYGESKLKAEEGLHDLASEGFKVCILRPPMIYGPGCKGNYQSLVKYAKTIPVFPDIKNERSMLHIDNLSRVIKTLIDETSDGLVLPQDGEYVCTSQLVKDLAEQQGKKLYLIKIFNPLLRLLSGRVAVIDKVFGGLVYALNNAS